MLQFSQNDWDEAEKPYKFICDMMDSIDDSIDDTIRCVFETKSYQKELENLSGNSNSTKTKNVASLMAPYLLKSLNNPFFDIKEVKEISESTGLTERQIRDFLRNQRKRKISYLISLHDAEKENIGSKLNYIYGFIDQAINEYTSIGIDENEQNDMGEFLFFPLKSS